MASPVLLDILDKISVPQIVTGPNYFVMKKLNDVLTLYLSNEMVNDVLTLSKYELVVKPGLPETIFLRLFLIP